MKGAKIVKLVKFMTSSCKQDFLKATMTLLHGRVTIMAKNVLRCSCEIRYLWKINNYNANIL